MLEYGNFLFLPLVAYLVTRMAILKKRAATGFFRATVIIMAAVYLCFSVGIIKATHFCMGREASVTYFSTETKKCPCSLFAKESDSCCDDDRDLIRIEDDQQHNTAYTLSIPQLFILEDLYTERYIASVIENDHSSTFLDDDPSPPKTHLFKIHCSFVFYDDGTLS